MRDRISRIVSMPRASPAQFSSAKSESEHRSLVLRMRAMVVLPQPDGPERSKQWGIAFRRPRSWSRATAAFCPYNSDNRIGRCFL